MNGYRAHRCRTSYPFSAFVIPHRYCHCRKRKTYETADRGFSVFLADQPRKMRALAAPVRFLDSTARNTPPRTSSCCAFSRRHISAHPADEVRDADTGLTTGEVFISIGSMEPVIGHLTAEHRMGRNYLAKPAGDAVNAVLAGSWVQPPVAVGLAGSSFALTAGTVECAIGLL